MPRWVQALFALLLAGLSACLAAGCSSPSPAERDSWRVLCLSPAKRPDLIDAAITLGLATPASTPDRLRIGGREMTAGQWRQEHRDDFDKSCEAVVDSPEGATGGGNGFLLSTATTLVSAMAGGLLTLAGGIAQAKFTDSRRRAENLRSAAHRYARTSRAYLDAWVRPGGGQGRPDVRGVTEHGDDLDAELRGCQSARGGRLPIRSLRDDLRAVTDDLADGPGTDQERWTERARRKVSDLETRIERVSVVLEHPLRRLGGSE